MSGETAALTDARRQDPTGEQGGNRAGTLSPQRKHHGLRRKWAGGETLFVRVRERERGVDVSPFISACVRQGQFKKTLEGAMRQILLTVSLIPAVIITPRQDAFKLALCLFFLLLFIYLFIYTWTKGLP